MGHVCDNLQTGVDGRGKQESKAGDERAASQTQAGAGARSEGEGEGVGGGPQQSQTGPGEERGEPRESP